MKTIIAGGTIVNEGKSQKGDLVIEDGIMVVGNGPRGGPALLAIPRREGITAHLLAHHVHVVARLAVILVHGTILLVHERTQW
jgi:hypothetical protein